MDIKHFLDDLASSSPTPGGGSASALAGALAASLVAMVAGLSPKQKGMKKIRNRALILQRRLFRAIEEDAEGYQGVLAAFRLPKNTEREKLRRARAVQRAFVKATVAPQLVTRLSLELLELCLVAVREGNPNAVSDAGVGASMADTAVKGGLMNIRINLAPVKDKAFIRKMQALIREAEKKRNQRMGRIEKALHQVGS